jgi:hypothetical protein
MKGKQQNPVQVPSMRQHLKFGRGWWLAEAPPQTPVGSVGDQVDNGLSIKPKRTLNGQSILAGLAGANDGWRITCLQQKEIGKQP